MAPSNDIHLQARQIQRLCDEGEGWKDKVGEDVLKIAQELAPNKDHKDHPSEETYPVEWTDGKRAFNAVLKKLREHAGPQSSSPDPQPSQPAPQSSSPDPQPIQPAPQSSSPDPQPSSVQNSLAGQKRRLDGREVDNQKGQNSDPSSSSGHALKIEDSSKTDVSTGHIELQSASVFEVDDHESSIEHPSKPGSGDTNNV